MSHEHKSHIYHQPHFRIVKAGEAGRFFSTTDEAGITLFVTDEAEHLDFIVGSARRSRIPLLEALAFHHFHSFVLMHILGDNSDLVGDDNDDHQHSLIRGVLQPNAADVINWRPLEKLYFVILQ